MSTSPDQVAEFVFAKAAARRNATLIQVAALAGAALCISLAASLQAPINRQRKELELVLQSNLYQELPPQYVWVSAVGGAFRGLVADVLWMVSQSEKEKGSFFEQHQLAKLICTLQPRFPQVWSFQSWNMAYNISVATHTGAERWQWVYNGIRLLRDEGIPNNERAVPLYHQLAWTYFHKIGDRMDDFHQRYKRVWAETMEVLLGSPPAGLSDEEQANYLKPVADAPLKLETLIEQRPGVAKLVDQLKGLGVDVDADTAVANLLHPLEVNFFKPYTAWLINRDEAAFQKKAIVLDAQTAKLWAFFETAPAEDFAALIAYMRAEVLREQYKMDPKFMQAMTGRFGTEKPVPIDWRTPWAHGMYWGMYGTEKGRQVKSVKDFDLLNTDRIVVYALGQIWRQGHYLLRPNLDSPEDSILDMSPDWRYVEAIHRKCLELGKIYAEKGEQVDNTAGEAFRDFHINTLQTAVLNLHLAGQEKQAQHYFEYLVNYYRDPVTDKIRDPYDKPFHDFIQREIKEVVQSQQEVLTMLHSLMFAAYLALGNGQADEYATRFRSASDLYKGYAKDTADDREGRRTLPPWEQIQADALGTFVINPGLPMSLRFAVWSRVETTGANMLEVKRRCYDQVRKALNQIYAKNDEYDLDKAFPPPRGMDEWRKSNPIMTPEQVAKQAEEKKKAEEKKAKGGK